MVLPTIVGIMLSGRLSGCLLAPILRDTISLQLLEWFQRNLVQIFTVWMAIAEKVFKVRGQRSRS